MIFVRNLFHGLTWSLLILSAAAVVGCGGGGGGGDGGGGRTTDTAVRLIHGTIDGAPLTVRAGQMLLQKARFAELTDYVPVAEGATALTVERVNSPGVVLDTIPSTLEPETEYTVFVTGLASTGAEHAALLPEPVARPEAGFGRVQLLNAVAESSSISLKGAGVDSGPVNEGASSGFIDVAAGPQTFTVTDRNGRSIGSAQFVLADRGEMTIVATGSSDLGLVFIRLYPDLD